MIAQLIFIPHHAICLGKSWFPTSFLPSRFLIFLLFASALPNHSFAQAGTLDISFGTNGKVITILGDFGDNGNSIAIQSDEKILLGGYSQSSFTSSDFALLRYNKDGTLDQTFGIDGKVITPVANRSEGNSLAIQSDGKILLGGSSKWYLNLVRYQHDGNLDTTFGSGGKVITDIAGYYREQCKSIAIQSDGKILVGGYGQHNSNDMSYLVLLRYHIDGTLDSTFGTSGTVIGSQGKWQSIGIQGNGKILLGGSFDFSFALQRYNLNGSLDTTFGTNGIVITPVGNSSEANSLQIQNDGKIVLGGHSNSQGTSRQFALVRYHNDGSLDQSFGINGIATSPIGISSMGNSLFIQHDGKILLAGEAKDHSNTSHFAIARYHSDGTLDQTFGTDGTVMTIIGKFSSRAKSLSIHHDGTIVLIGHVLNNETNLDIALVRYHGDTGVGIEEVCCIEREIKVFPNPFHSSTKIQVGRPLHDAELILYNAYGQEVKHLKNMSGQEIQLSRANLASGFYFLELRQNNTIIATDKLIIFDQ